MNAAGTTVAVWGVVGLVWYAFVEITYFTLNGPHFRRTFAAANRVSVDAFTYRGVPWVPLIAYVVLLTSLALLAVAPAVRAAVIPFDDDDIKPSKAYLYCLWRAVLLCAAVYGVYDLTTYATIGAFGLRTAVADMAYGVLVVPALIVAPIAAFMAHGLIQRR